MPWLFIGAQDLSHSIAARGARAAARARRYLYPRVRLWQVAGVAARGMVARLVHMRWNRKFSGFWITTLLTIGTALALVLLAQTVATYRYVSNTLIQDEAQRVAGNTVRAVERAVRHIRARDDATFQLLLDELQSERGDQVAGLALRLDQGTILAAGVLTDRQRFGPSDRTAARRGMQSAGEQVSGRELLVGDFSCRCDRFGGAGGTGPASGRASLTIALYRDSLTAPFTRLRRNAIVSTSAALTLLTALAIIALRFRFYVRGKQLEAQVSLAREVQRNLLPDPDSLPTNLDVAAECLPASRVSGDFFDVVTLPAGRYAFVVGDVSGHGIAAALLMGLIHGAMNGPPWGATGDDEAERAGRLNDLLLNKSSTERFASLFWCVLDPASGRLRYVNAGHPPPIWISRGPEGSTSIQRLAEAGPVLGVLANPTYPATSIQTRAGDLLLIFSDGLTEATNDRADFFGDDRLIALAADNAQLPARALCRLILEAVRTFAGSRPIEDDQTLLVVRLPGPAGR